MAQVALGVVGGVAGFLVGGPAGAAIGFSLGMALGAPEIPGPTLGEIAKQTAKEGDPRLIVWGIVRPVGPNLIAVQDPPAIYKVSQGGKGGSGPRAEVPFRTYALGVCEGPITGYRRIWRNNKLVYDGRNGSVWGAINNPVFMQKATFYYGDYSQLPDPDLEAVFGVGNVPAHRGTAYIVLKNEDLQDTGGAVPQWIFEVVRAQYEYEPESTEILLSHSGTENLTSLNVDDWSVINEYSTGSSVAYTGDYVNDISLIVSNGGTDSIILGRDSRFEVDNIPLGETPFAGMSAKPRRTQFAYGMSAAPFLSVLTAMEYEGGYSFSVDSPDASPIVQVYDLAYNPDGNLLAVSHARWTKPGGDLESSQYVTVYDSSSGYSEVGHVKINPVISANSSTAVAWSSESNRLYLSSAYGPRLRAVSWPGVANVPGVPEFSVDINCLSVDPSGALLAVGFADGRILVMSTFNFSTVFDQANSGMYVVDMRFSPGARYLAVSLEPSVSGNSTLIIFDTEDFSVAHQSTDITSRINSIRWSPIQPVGL